MDQRQVLTLAVDCGGGGIKASVLDAAGTLQAPPVRTVTPYPLPPGRLVDVVAELAAQLPPADRLTLGMPGMIRHGVVVETPHYVTRSGPRTRVLPELVDQWAGFGMRAALQDRLGLPALVLNDAEVHGAGAVSGVGLEMILTLGTGLGNAVFDGGVLAPHVEISQGPIGWGLTYDEYIGEHERLRLGDSHWSRRVRRIVEALRPMYRWDRLYLGGGNARRITAVTLDRLGDEVVVVPNSAGIVGGVRAWDLRAPGERARIAAGSPALPADAVAPQRPAPFAARGRPGARLSSRMSTPFATRLTPRALRTTRAPRRPGAGGAAGPEAPAG